MNTSQASDRRQAPDGESRQPVLEVIEARVPSRIAVDLLDMNGELGRLDGAAGFALEDPHYAFSMQPAEGFSLGGGNLVSQEMRTAILESLVRLAGRFSTGGASIDIRSAIPEHSGFGSKTATLLGTGKAYALLYGLEIDYRELARICGRGGTSGIGVNTICLGGFVIDGGHSRVAKPAFAPSSASRSTTVPLVVAHHRMPNWPMLVATLRSERFHGPREVTFFREHCPISPEGVAETARRVLVQLLPSIVESDVALFAAAVNGIQKVGWKKLEVDGYGRRVWDLMHLGRSAGAMGAGMSSIGPTVYFVGGDLERVKDRVMNERNDLTLLQIVRPSEHGAVFG